MAERITGHTELIGLMAYPIRHSSSPAMHNEAFATLGLDYAYLAFEVDNSTLEDAVKGLRALKMVGSNVSMPNKTVVGQYLDELSPAAKMAGAVNTIVNDNGRLTGHITDGEGFVHNLKDHGIDIKGKKITVAGGGGAATAICTQAALDGVKEIDIFRRNRPEAFAQTVAFADRTAKDTGCKIHVYDFADETQMKKSLAESAILTNATNVGMAPDTDAIPIPDVHFLHPELIVSDIIYNPRQTQLLKIAASMGCPVFNGMYMLLYQGAAAFECWTGLEMPVAEIKKKYFS